MQAAFELADMHKSIFLCGGGDMVYLLSLITRKKEKRLSNLNQQLVFGEALDGFQQVRVQAQLVL